MKRLPRLSYPEIIGLIGGSVWTIFVVLVGLQANASPKAIAIVGTATLCGIPLTIFLQRTTRKVFHRLKRIGNPNGDDSIDKKSEFV